MAEAIFISDVQFVIDIISVCFMLTSNNNVDVLVPRLIHVHPIYFIFFQKLNNSLVKLTNNFMSYASDEGYLNALIANMFALAEWLIHFPISQLKDNEKTALSNNIFKVISQVIFFNE
jgi:hypothetical protein